VDGEVRGFSSASTDLQGNLMDVNVDQETLRELSQKKQVLVHVHISLSLFGVAFSLRLCFTTAVLLSVARYI